MREMRCTSADAALVGMPWGGVRWVGAAWETDQAREGQSSGRQRPGQLQAPGPWSRVWRRGGGEAARWSRPLSRDGQGPFHLRGLNGKNKLCQRERMRMQRVAARAAGPRHRSLALGGGGVASSAGILLQRRIQASRRRSAPPSAADVYPGGETNWTVVHVLHQARLLVRSL